MARPCPEKCVTQIPSSVTEAPGEKKEIARVWWSHQRMIRYDGRMNSDPLPTPDQHKLLCGMIHRAFLQIRQLGWDGRSEQAAELADAFHNVPLAIQAKEFFSWEYLRNELRSHPDFLEMLSEIELSSSQIMPDEVV
jgi:hypothetical protein